MYLVNCGMYSMPSDNVRDINLIALLHWLVKNKKMDKKTAREIYKKQISLEFENDTRYIWDPDCS